MSKILVTGSHGQLGQEIYALHKNNSQFIFCDKNDLDITDSTALKHFFERENITHTINCAAYTAVDLAEDESDIAHLINCYGVKNIVDASKMHNCRVIHISTDFVFDGKTSIPYNEEDFANPISIYGRTKHEGEKYVLEYSNGVVIRTSWLYSSYGNNFVKTMLRLFRSRDVVNVINDQFGVPTYTFDLAEVILSKILFSSNIGLFHYSNEGVASWYDFAYEILQLSKEKCDLNPIPTSSYPTKACRPHFSVMNKSRIIETFGVSIAHWKGSLSKCIKLLNEGN